MHEAFDAVTILEKLPLEIESVACYGETLLVGTKVGHLLVYTIRDNPSSPSADAGRFIVTLAKSCKNFAKKPIVQLQVVPEFHLLLCLADATVSVYDLSVFNLIHPMPKTRGASLLAVDVQATKSLSGEVVHTLRLAVALRRKVQVYYWKNREFHELRPDLSLSDTPKSIAWVGESLIFGFSKQDYLVHDFVSSTEKELFSTGKHPEPLVAKVGASRVALSRDEMIVFLNAKGEPTHQSVLNFTEPPLNVVHIHPYILALMPKCVEVCTADPKTTAPLTQRIQTIDLGMTGRHARQLNIVVGSSAVEGKTATTKSATDHVCYVASSNNVWRLVSVSLTSQIRQLLQEKQFQLALELSDMIVEEKTLNRETKRLYAFHLFTLRRFKESFTIYAALDTEPPYVIGLFPNLLPPGYKQSFAEYPEKVPALEGGELEIGVLELIDYLTQKRYELLMAVGGDMKGDDPTTSKSRTLMQIIDTTLLKCYLMTNDSMVGPLLRTTNFCHLEESENLLRERRKFSELTILYEKKGQHRKALEVLKKQASRSDPQMGGISRTITYLQHLGADFIDLILEFSTWVLDQDGQEGLTIFTEDLPEVDSLPRDKVLHHLEQHADPSLPIAYLEHLIHDSRIGETEPVFHNALIKLYLGRVRDLYSDYLQTLPPGEPPPNAGHEPGDLGVWRDKLLKFLKSSTHYKPDRLLTHFPSNQFFEERAILLGRSGRHEDALAIYVVVLNDLVEAEAYCERVINAPDASTDAKQVFLHLLRLYLDPQSAGSDSVHCPANASGTRGLDPGERVRHAFRLLEAHPGSIDTVKALEMLPSSIPVSDVCLFLENVIKEKASCKRNAQILKSLLFAEHLQAADQKIFFQSRRCVVAEETMCAVCRKRIGNSAFAKRPDGTILHYYCSQDKLAE